MEQKYESLKDLLSSNEKARLYFNALPKYTQEMIGARQDNIRSENELHRFADNILAGDK